MLKRSLISCTVLVLYTACASGARQAPRATVRADLRPSVRAALDSFIVDFNALDSARFDARWAPDPSAVLPFADTPERLDGRAAVLARFHAYFAQMRRERTGPPFLFMVLRDVRIDLLSDEVALVAYAFDAGGRANRRTLVMVRGADRRWRIVQMHGSSAAVP